MPTQWSEAEQVPLGCIAPYAAAAAGTVLMTTVGGDAHIAPYAAAAPRHQASLV